MFHAYIYTIRQTKDPMTSKQPGLRAYAGHDLHVEVEEEGV